MNLQVLRGACRLTFVIVLLSLLMGLQPIATDPIPPPLPELTASSQRRHGAGPADALTACCWLRPVAAGLGPAVGPHRPPPVLLAGMGLFTLASIGSTFAGGPMEALIGWRGLRGLGMGASMMGAPRSATCTGPADGARVMSKALGGLGLIARIDGLAGAAPGLARALACVALFAAAVLALLLWRQQDAAAARPRWRCKPARLLANWG